LSLKKVTIFVIKRVLIKAKPFIPESIREETLTMYLLKDKLHGTVKCNLSIN
jgi:hypothetical protein